MNDRLDRRLRAATGAGWRVLVIWWLLLALSWVVYLVIMDRRPEWIRALWGGYALQWEQIQEVYVWLFGVMKIMLLAWLIGVLFLTFLRRGLKRAAEESG